MKPYILPLLLPLSHVTLADNKNDDAIETITTTASRTEALATPYPLTISTLSEAQLNSIAPTHVEESLQRIAGANVQRGNGQEYLPALRSPVLSGAAACGGILTLEDGIPLRAAGFCNINELFEAHSEMAKRIEVLKGPGSALYGSNAVHGVINVITPDTTQGGGLFGLDYGSYGYARYKLRAGKDYGNSGIGINASVTDDTGYRDDESVKQQKVNIRHRFENDNLLLTSGLTYTNLDQQTAGFITGFESYKNEDIAQQNFDPDAFRKARSFRAWSNAQWQFKNGNVLSITPYVRDQSMDFFKHFLPGTPLETNSQTGIGVQSLYQHNLQSNIKVNLGLDGEYTRSDFTQSQNEPTQGSAFLVATVPQGKHYDYDVNATLYAPFASVEWQLNKWFISAGLRYEHMQYDYTNNMLTGRTKDDDTECGFGGCRYSRPASVKNSFSNTSPKLGVSYKVNKNNTLYANFSRGYRAPQAAELYQLQREQTTANLNPEIANNAELGLKGYYTDVSYALAVYAMSKHNTIYRDSDFYNVNDGRSRHRGIELEVDYALSKTLNLQFAGTHAEHTYTNNQLINGLNINGNNVDTAPRNVANLDLTWQAFNNLALALQWHSVSSYYTDPENRHSYEGHDILSLRAKWQVTKNLEVLARIINLTDEAYAERADYTSFTGDRYFPGKPRNAMISATYTW
ncbi:TonB-dependent receptor [Pseudoalteromonas sp. S3785]|uniref:TonB-dependent receptor n=1 Tax=Pseudoalteromonas sp. S3785 TaxID=579545 RepID=UPI00110B7D98|nr:TonB-dependent receptor [Pseudoalteromonas sp. S3785]TMO77524.1 TonB-dependent receptor [Pseudoalteromonas sp. S3785]